MIGPLGASGAGWLDKAGTTLASGQVKQQAAAVFNPVKGEGQK